MTLATLTTTSDTTVQTEPVISSEYVLEKYKASIHKTFANHHLSSRLPALESLSAIIIGNFSEENPVSWDGLKHEIASATSYISEKNKKTEYRYALVDGFEARFKEALLTKFAKDSFHIAVNNNLSKELAANLSNRLLIISALNQKAPANTPYSDEEKVDMTLDQFFTDIAGKIAHQDRDKIHDSVLAQYKTRFTEPAVV